MDIYGFNSFFWNGVSNLNFLLCNDLGVNYSVIEDLKVTAISKNKFLILKFL